MSVTMTKAEGVTLVTLTSDRQSSWPPLCQIFKGLCYSPVCCSVSQDLRRIQRSSQSVLGTLQIMVGLLNLGLGGILLGSRSPSWHMYFFGKFPFWLGVLFIVFGIVCILSEKYPSPCLVILTVVLNLAGVAFAITAIVMYSIHTAETYWRGWYWYCRRDNDYDYWYRRRHSTTTPSPERDVLQEKCLEARELAKMLLLGINGVLIVLSVLELCVVISSVVLGIKAHIGHDCAALLLFVFLQMLGLGINGVLIVLSVLEFCVVISSVVLGINAHFGHDCAALLLFLFLQMLLFGINGVLIVLSVLEFCVVISSVMLGIKAHFGHDCAVLLLIVFLQTLVLGINIVLIVLSVLELCVASSSVVLGIKALLKHSTWRLLLPSLSLSS